HDGPIAFTSEVHPAEIYSQAADGTGVTRLTNDPAASRWPAVAPDGRIAFASKRADGWGIFVMNANGSDLHQVLGPRRFLGWPDWSPDGTKLAVTVDVDDHYDILVLDFAASTTQDITPDRSE